MKEFLQCNQQQQGATVYVNPASLAQLNSWTKYIYTYPKKRKNHKKEQGTDLFLVIANSCKSNEASCVGNPCVKVRFTSIEDSL
jgi:hypothetical protein